MSNGKPILTGLIQTDASINQGSSGGALLNLDGELVGINLAIVQGANSVGLAIPYERIKRFLKDYRDGKLAMKKELSSPPRGQVNVIKIPIQ